MILKFMRLQLAGYVSLVKGDEGTRNTFRVLVGKLLGKPRRRWKDNIKMDFWETDCENW